MLFGPQRREALGPVPKDSVVWSTASGTGDKEMVDSETFQRRDGRFPEQVRSIAITPSPLSKATGSCYLETQGMRLLVSASAPKPASRSKIYKTLGAIECRVRYACGPEAAALSTASTFDLVNEDPSTEARRIELGRIVGESLSAVVQRQSFPNSYIMVDVLVLGSWASCSDYEVIAGALNAAGVALCMAGVEMTSSVACLSFAMTDSLLMIDPTCDELETLSAHGQHGKGVVVCRVRGGKPELASVLFDGLLESEALLLEAVRQVSEGCLATFEAVIRPALAQ